MGEAINGVLGALSSTAAMIVVAAIIGIAIVLTVTFRRRPTVVPVDEAEAPEEGMVTLASAGSTPPPAVSSTLFYGSARNGIPARAGGGSDRMGLIAAGVVVVLLSVLVLPRLGGSVDTVDEPQTPRFAEEADYGTAGGATPEPVVLAAAPGEPVLCSDTDDLHYNDSGFVSGRDAVPQKPFHPSKTISSMTYRLCMNDGRFAYFDLMEIAVDGAPLVAAAWTDDDLGAPDGDEDVPTTTPDIAPTHGIGSTPAYVVRDRRSIVGKMPVLTAANGPTAAFGLHRERADLLPPPEAFARSTDFGRAQGLDVYDAFVTLGTASAEDGRRVSARRGTLLAAYVLSEIRAKPGAANCTSRAHVFAASATATAPTEDAMIPIVLGVRFDSPATPDTDNMGEVIETFLSSDGIGLADEDLTSYALSGYHVNTAACERTQIHSGSF